MAKLKVHKLSPYLKLIEEFTLRRIPAAEFEREYLQMFKNDVSTWTEEEYEVLNDLFCDVDSFCSDPRLRDNNDLDEVQLRDSANTALEKLSEIDKSIVKNA
jgi:hypothetical protein